MRIELTKQQHDQLMDSRDFSAAAWILVRNKRRVDEQIGDFTPRLHIKIHGGTTAYQLSTEEHETKWR